MTAEKQIERLNKGEHAVTYELRQVDPARGRVLGELRYIVPMVPNPAEPLSQMLPLPLVQIIWIGDGMGDGMTDKIELKWKWREHRDGDIGSSRYKCFDICIQDCDGDYAEWSIKRGDLYIAMGQERDIDPAIAKVIEVLGYLGRAVDFNDFIAAEQRRRIRDEAGIAQPSLQR